MALAVLVEEVLVAVELEEVGKQIQAKNHYDIAKPHI